MQGASKFIARFPAEKGYQNKELGDERSKQHARMRQQQKETAAMSKGSSVDMSKDMDPGSKQPSTKSVWVWHCFDPSADDHGK